MSTYKNVSCWAAIIVLLLIPVQILAQGWAVSMLWGWIVVPLGFPAISLLAALGLVLLAGVIVHQDTSLLAKRQDITDSDLLGAAIGQIVAPIITVFLGWIFFR